MKKIIQILWLLGGVICLAFCVLRFDTRAPLFKTLSGIENFLSERCLWPSDKSSCSINEKILQEKMRAGLPNWAKEQIAKDLSQFRQLKASDLAYYHQDPKFNMLFHFQIRNGQVMTKHKDNLNILPAYKIMYDAFQYLAARKYLPDTEFLVGLGDYFKSGGKSPVPIFVFARDEADLFEQDLVLMPDWMNLRSISNLRPRIKRAIKNFPWEKKKPLVFWRGSEACSTGFRQKLVVLSTQFPEQIDAKFVDKQAIKFVEPEDHLRYRYLISVDGVRCTWVRLVWHLHSNSLVFKHQSSQKQWFYAGIKPYVHYIPVQDERALLKEIHWANEHPIQVRSMIERSIQFSEDNLALEDMYHYLIILLQEYSKKFERVKK